MNALQKWKIRKRWKKYKKLDSLNIVYIKPKDYPKLKKHFQKKRNKIKITKNDADVILLSKNMDFSIHIDKLVNFTDQIKKISNSSSSSLQIDHKKIDKISIAALVYIVAQIDYIAQKKFNSFRRLKYNKKLGLNSKNYRLKYIFYKIGYWKYFGIKKPYKIDKELKDIIFLHIHSDTKDNFKFLNSIRDFIKNKVNLFNDYIVEYKFDDAIKEALGNALEHAYPKNFDIEGKRKGKWWVCGFYDKKSESVEIIFYDYGVGIRKSIEINLDKKADRSLLDLIRDKLIHDGELLKIALTAELSKYNKYKEKDRGKGFKRFKEFAETLGNKCKLTIVSGNGKLIVDLTGNQEDIVVQKINGKIDGMLIKWQIFMGGRNGDNKL